MALIRTANENEIDDVLPLMRGYCDFYGASPPDSGLREMARALISDPEQGSLFVAVEEGVGLVGFASLGWKWSSTRGARIGVMEDLFIDPGNRGKGTADQLIEACAERCRERGAPALEWVTAPDNKRAQAVYDRVGGSSSPWLVYDLKV